MKENKTIEEENIKTKESNESRCKKNEENMHNNSSITNSTKSNPIIKEIARFFCREIREECWKRAQTVPGRNPDRWRLDSVGNIVCKKLNGCEGCLCYEHDHIIPHSKGGLSSLENCQILQSRVNRYKGNDSFDSLPQQEIQYNLFQYSCHKKFVDFELDLIEIALWGNIKSSSQVCRCKSWMELTGTWMSLRNSKNMQKYAEVANCDDSLYAER